MVMSTEVVSVAMGTKSCGCTRKVDSAVYQSVCMRMALCTCVCLWSCVCTCVRASYVCVYMCVYKCACLVCVYVCMCHLGNCSFQRLAPLPHFNTHFISLWSWRLVGTRREPIINYVHKSHHVSTEFGLTQEWKKLVTFWSLCGDIGL